MKEQGVFKTFKDMHDASYSSGHPGAKGNGLGWARYTHKPDGIHIDEIQSDFGQSFAKQAQNQLQAKVANGDMTQKEADEHAARFKQRWPDDHYDKIKNIVFNGKHANEVIHEAFKQHLRDSGQDGKNIHMWTSKGKAPLSGMSENEENPVWMKSTYDQTPKKMGYKSAKYGDIETQDNPRLKGQDTWKHILKKARVTLNTLNKSLGNKK